MTRRDTIGTKNSKRPLLRRIISGSTSLSVAQSPPRAAITILTNPARTRAHSASSTVHEEETPSQLSTVCRPSSPSPTPSGTYSILNNPARGHSLPPIPLVLRSRSPPRITILSDLEREKREAHPRSPPAPKSILLSSAETHSLCSINTHTSSRSSIRQ